MFRTQRQRSPRACCGGLLVALAVLTGAVGASPAHGFEKAFKGPTRANGRSLFPVYRDLGVKIFQYSIRWDEAAPNRPLNPSDPWDPAYRWPADLDYAIEQADTHGMHLAVMLIGAPGWANGGRGWLWAPRDPGQYATFAAAAAQRYPSVHRWMVWGEPSRGANFQPLTRETSNRWLTRRQSVAPRLYARLLDAAYVALKRVRPSNLVIGGNTLAGGDISTLNWMRYMRLPDGRSPRLDLYGHNPFSFREPDLRDPPSRQCFVKKTGRCFGDMSDIVRVAHGVDRYVAPRRWVPLFLSEYTIPTAPDSEFNFWVTPATQARWIRRALSISRGFRRIAALGWVHLVDGLDGPGINGGLLDARWRRKPGYVAFQRG